MPRARGRQVSDHRESAMKTVMVVEDHADTREAMATVLSDAGFEVVECDNGQTALSQLVGRSSLPDVIVLDLAMPIMSGAEFMRVLRGYLRLGRVPIIIVTGVSDSVVEDTAPVVARITKPWEPRELVQLVTDAVA